MSYPSLHGMTWARYRRRPKYVSEPSTAATTLLDRGLASSHWGKRVLLAELTGGFTAQDRSMSESWVTCACGLAGKWIERNDLGRPADFELFNGGMSFNACVTNDNYQGAAFQLARIEARAIELHYQGMA